MENLLSTPWVVGLGIICIVLLGWWIEVGSERRHLRQSVKEACQAREEFFAHRANLNQRPPPTKADPCTCPCNCGARTSPKENK